MRSQAASRRAETTWYSQTYSPAPATLDTQRSRDFVQLVAHSILFGARGCSSATKLFAMLYHERTTTRDQGQQGQGERSIPLHLLLPLTLLLRQPPPLDLSKFPPHLIRNFAIIGELTPGCSRGFG